MKKLILLLCFFAGFTGDAISQFTADLDGYPLITTGWVYGGFATVIDSTVQLTTPATNENGYVYYDSVTNLTSCAQFSVKFDYRIITDPPTGVADGIAFFYIANPPSGFITGGGLGLPGSLTGMVFTLDTWDNDGDGLNPESQLFGYTTASTYSEANRTQMITTIRGGETFMDDGTWHHCEIDYNAGNINVYYDYSPIAGMTGFYLITIPSGYFGFSSSTGAAFSTQSVKNVHIVATGIAPAPTVTSPVTYCQFASPAGLTATGIGPFSWFITDTATIDSVVGGITPSTATVGSKVYFVRQGVGTCISIPDSIIVIVNPLPAAPLITGTTTYCSGDTPAPFSIAGATGTVMWYTTGTGGVGSTTPILATTASAGTTTYWVSQIAGGCESPRDSIAVQVIGTPPAPTITGTNTYCQYFPYIAPTSTGTNVLWYATATGGVGTITPPAVSTTIPGTYAVYATQSDSGCTSVRASFPITINAQPGQPVIADSPGKYCPGQPFMPFTVISGSSVAWYMTYTGGAGSGTPPIINTSVPGYDTVWVTQTVLGCESERYPVAVTVYNNITSGFTYSKHLGCTADTVVFTDTSTGASSYLWDFGDEATSAAVNPTHIYHYQGMDTVVLQAMSPYCMARDTQIIDLVHPLHAQFIADTNLICQGGTITFTDSSYAKAGTTLSYLWHFDDGDTSSSANPSHFYPHTGVYNVYEVATDFVPCHDTVRLTISVDSISPIHMAITDTVICQGTYTTFNGIYSPVGNVGVTWTLGNSQVVKDVNPISYAFDTVGTFVVSAEAIYRVCPDTSVRRTITVIPQPSINIGTDTTICKGSKPFTITDIANVDNPKASWVWNTGATSPTITITEPGTYSAMVHVGGCNASAAVKVSNDCYINIPNVFTPNGDGLNDYFFPRLLLTSGLTTFKMDIYNRWGQMIFESTSLDGAGWDGKLNNVDQPEDVYVYVMDATFKDGQKEHHQGNVTLLR